MRDTKLLVLARVTSAQPAPADPAAPPAMAPDPLTAIAILVLGLVALVLLYVFLETWRRAYITLTREGLRQVDLALHVVSVLGTASLPAADGAPLADEDRPTLTIKGPPRIDVGKPAMFELRRDGALARGTWAVDGKGTVDPTEGDTAKVTATAPGRIRLRVSYETTSGPVLVISDEIEAVDPPGRSLPIPLIAHGYGAFTVAILAVSVAAALTAAGWLPSAALATLLGTVVSYFFVKQDHSPGGG